MRMIMSLAFLSALSISKPALSQISAQTAFTHGSWLGEAFYDGRNFMYCAMTAQYSGGISFSLVLNKDLGWGILLNRPANSNQATSFAVDLSVDGKIIHRGQAQAFDRKSSLVPLPFTDTVVYYLRQGKNLNIRTPYTSDTFPLTGTSVSISELTRCVLNRAPTTPQPAPPPPQDANFLNRQELMELAREILERSDQQDYRFLPLSPNNPEILWWEFEDKRTGGIIAVRNSEALQEDQVIAETSKLESSKCAGDFATGRRAPRYLRGQVIVKAFISCRSVQLSYYDEYSVIKSPNGIMFMYIDRSDKEFQQAGPNPKKEKFEEELAVYVSQKSQ